MPYAQPDRIAEGEFILRIDARFPYKDKRRCEVLIEEARAISANAVFMVLHEICRGEWVRKRKPLALELLEAWRDAWQHPLVAPLSGCAIALIRGEVISDEQAASLMTLISQHPYQYNALAIAHAAAATPRRLDQLARQVIATWAMRQS